MHRLLQIAVPMLAALVAAMARPAVAQDPDACAMVNELGWTRLNGDNNYYILPYISEDSGGGAYTTVDYCQDGRSWMPYMVTYQNVFSGMGDWYEDMAVHEFNHAQQFNYGFAHEFWWWEATATYIQESAQPSNNWWADYINGGFFFFQKEFISRLPANENTSLEADPLAQLAADGELFAFRHDGFWGCMDTMRDRENLEKIYESGKAPWAG